MKKKTLPCNVPCPVCGSLDIARHYRIAGDIVATYRDANTMFTSAIDLADMLTAHEYHNKVVRETITCYCRVCQLHFNTPPLRK